ncbi:MAG: MipA/OmpV family protein [Acidobacteriota bacterium]
MRSVLAITITFLAFQAARADTTKNPLGPWYMQDYDEKRWRVEAAVGYEVAPTYPGSDETETGPDGFLRIVLKDAWNNRYTINPLGVSGAFDLTDDLALLVQVEHEAGGDGESADFEGLDEIEDTIDGQFTLSYRWGDAYIRAALQPDLLGRGKGLVWFAGGGYDYQNDRFGFRTYLGLTGGDDTHMDTEFDITEEESERTDLRVYDPSGGLKNFEFQCQLEYELNDHWSLYGVTDVEQYLGNAADSPLIKDIGSDFTVEAFVGVLFRW